MTLWVLQAIGAAVVPVFPLWVRQPIIGSVWLGTSVAAMAAVGLTSRAIVLTNRLG